MSIFLTIVISLITSIVGFIGGILTMIGITLKAECKENEEYKNK